MKCYGRVSGNLNRTAGLSLLAILFLLSFSQAGFGEESYPETQKDTKKLLKEAKKHARAGLFTEAENVLRQAAQIDATRADVKVELAYVLVKQRRILEAYDLVFPIARSDPKNARAMAVLGVMLLTSGRFQEARLLFSRAIRADRREDLAWAGYGMTDFYENRISESLANLREAVFHAPDEPDHIFALAQVSSRSERYKEAAEAYETFLQISKSTDVDRRARIKGLIKFLRYLGNSASLYTTSGSEQANVPFDLEGNRPVIKLRVNDHPDPMRFVLDTGSGISVLSEKTAKALKIKPITKGGYARGIGGDGKFEIVYGLVREIGIGEITVRNVPVYIRKFHSTSDEVDGYIGLSLISKFLTTIDYGSRNFVLTKKNEATKAFRENNALSLPLRLTSSGFLSGEVQLEGVEIPLNFIVDTGASVSVISDAVAKTEPISLFESDDKLRVVGSAGVTDDVSTFMLPRVSFGGHSRKDIMAVALDLGIINEASGFEQSGILGGNFLKNYKLTFDFKNSRVTFVSVQPEKD